VELPGLSEEPTVASERIYRGRVVALRVDRVALGDGAPALREIVEHADVAVVVAVDGKGRVALVRQYRKAVERALLEVPAGGIEEGEDPEQGAKRELEEETGLRASVWRRIGGFYSAPGYCTEFLHLFLASQLQQGVSRPDHDERIAVEWASLGDAIRLVMDGRICDAKSVAGLLMAQAHLAVHKASG